MVTMHFGGKTGTAVHLQPSEEMLVVRTAARGRMARAPVSEQSRAALQGVRSVARFPSAGVEILDTRASPDSGAVRAQLKNEAAFEFVGRALVHNAVENPIAYTENIFVKLRDDLSPRDVNAWIGERDPNLIQMKRRLDFARNAFFVKTPSGTGLRVFDLAEEMLADDRVELCHPEIVRQRARRAAYPLQWHLQASEIGGRRIDQHAAVAAAWEISRGAGVTVAIIDDGVDTTHPEFAGPDKVVAPYDATLGQPGAMPRFSDDDHGTACAGVAVAAGIHGASGVAPAARLMPIRLRSGLGSMEEAEAFYWASRNGADVISCSWGPMDGTWWDPNDPVHHEVVLLPDNTRLAIDAAAEQGRGGRGCVILFAAGNGNESVDNDGYASHGNVIAVAACNDMGTRSAYSDFGRAVWCCFPSSHGEPSLTTGIWTTDRTGTLGYNPGNPGEGDAAGYYTNSFGGTSSACPGAAGVVALMLAANPTLSREEVRDILKQCCDKIDKAGGAYDAKGHSRLYGYGRVNAERAVQLALGLDAIDTSLAEEIVTVQV